MMRLVAGGAVVAALFTSSPAFAGAASTATTTSQPSHSRGSFFTSNQNRSDVPTRVQRMFNELDVNHDGFVTKEEIATLQTRFDQRASAAAPKRAARMFARLDTNHDGQVTRAEVDAARDARLAAKGKPAKSTRHAASSLFAHADANKDGIVTHAEFDAATASGKIKLRHAKMRGSSVVREFDVADTNKDGRVSLEEAQQAALREFDVADGNHDGVITPIERRQASKAEREKRRTAG